MRFHSPVVPLLALATSAVLSLAACSDGSPAEPAVVVPTAEGAPASSSGATPANIPETVTDSAGDDVDAGAAVVETGTVTAPEPGDTPPGQATEDPVPVLGNVGAAKAVDGQGYGTVAPSLVMLTGVCASTLIADITWDSWGGETATGTGTPCVPAGMEDTISGGPEPLVASDPGWCGDVYAYRILSVDDEPRSICAY